MFIHFASFRFVSQNTVSLLNLFTTCVCLCTIINLLYHLVAIRRLALGLNFAHWLASRAGQAEDYVLCYVRKKKLSFSHVIDKARGQDSWISASFFFLRIYVRIGPSTPKKELGQYLAILTSRLVNNPTLPSLYASFPYQYCVPFLKSCGTQSLISVLSVDLYMVIFSFYNNFSVLLSTVEPR